MNELERQLVELGSVLEKPVTPDLMASVHGRLTPRRARRRGRLRLRRRSLALAIALVTLLAGTAVAVPPVRHAIERVLGLRGAIVERVPRLPPMLKNAGRQLKLGRRIPVDEARQAASFRALLPPRGVDAAYVSTDVAGGRVTLVMGRSLVMEFRGRSTPYVLKLIGPNTRARAVRVGGAPGIYLDGAPHELLFLDAHGNVRSDTIRLAGSVLLWQDAALTVRIEGVTSLANALALARSLK